MEYQVGDKVKIWHHSIYWADRCVGSVGTVLEKRTYGRRFLKGETFTHYVVKFDCYKIPHEYMRFIIEEGCDKIG